ncbi:MAG: hypothetical protein ACI9KE_004593 [Polyangiales bacterium]
MPGLTFDIRALTTAGTDPFADGAEFDRVRIRIKQEDSQVINLEALTAGTFDLSASFDSLSAPTRVRLELEGDFPLHGAPPIFAPGTSQGIVRFAVGAPSSCERVDGFDRDSAEGASYSRIDTFILGAGGRDSNSVWIFDLLRLATTELDPLPDAGRTASTRLGSSSALIISETHAAFRYDLAVDPNRDDRIARLELHDDADHTTALLTRENGGALAVGPGMEFSLIAPDGRVITGPMSVARDRPGLVELGGSLFIFGGNTEGALFEIVDVDRGTTTPMGDAILPPSVGALNVDGTVWLLHEDDTSSVLRGCPACEVAPGPETSAAVAGSTHLVTAGMLSTVLPGPIPPDQQPSLRPLASPLIPPRALFAYESDIVFLADDEGAQLCFPLDLAPL